MGHRAPLESFPLALAFFRLARARQKLIRYALKRRNDDDDAFLVGGPSCTAQQVESVFKPIYVDDYLTIEAVREALPRIVAEDGYEVIARAADESRALYHRLMR